MMGGDYSVFFAKGLVEMPVSEGAIPSKLASS